MRGLGQGSGTCCWLGEERDYIYSDLYWLILFGRLQAWHSKCYDKRLSTVEDKYVFACYSGFFAEIFARIRPVRL